MIIHPIPAVHYLSNKLPDKRSRLRHHAKTCPDGLAVFFNDQARLLDRYRQAAGIPGAKNLILQPHPIQIHRSAQGLYLDIFDHFFLRDSTSSPNPKGLKDLTLRHTGEC
jgi:hypothetical protein